MQVNIDKNEQYQRGHHLNHKPSNHQPSRLKRQPNPKQDRLAKALKQNLKRRKQAPMHHKGGKR